MRAKVTLAVLAMIFTAGSASAERFVVIALDVDGGSLNAVNLDTVRVIDGRTRAWLATFTAPKGDAPYRTDMLSEFDCRAERWRALTAKTYSGEGNLKAESGETSWDFPAPNSLGLEALRLACGQRVATPKEVLEMSMASLFKTFSGMVRDHRRGK